MPSPFPGMDPYLEARWSDVHATLIALIKEALQPCLPRDLRARTDEQVLFEEVGGDPIRRMRPDVAVLAEPIVIDLYTGPQIDRSVRIIDAANGNRVVTAVEVLSPWNNAAGRLNQEYRRKLDDFGRAGVSVVEIDLLRFPSRDRLAVIDQDLPAGSRTPYLICVRLGWQPERWLAYPVPLRSPVPPFPVPLRESDPTVDLHLQPLIERVYVAGGHDDIDYRVPPAPRLSGDDARWAAELLGSRSPT